MVKMVTLLIGKKGSGKTKRLIDEANAAVNSSDGCVVVVEKGSKLTYDIKQVITSKGLKYPDNNRSYFLPYHPS